MDENGLLTSVAVVLAAIGLVAVMYVRRKGNPFVHERELPWSIGIYSGPSPVLLAPVQGVTNPVLTAMDVSDVEARFVADPFMVRSDDTWHMFFEVLNATEKKGQIACATSNDAISWHYGQIVLDEPFHLSYPYVFAWEGVWYMVPECARSGGVRLYQADSFPTGWRFIGNILEGVDYVDTSIFRYAGKWWLFATRSYPHSHSLYLHFSDDLLGPWVEHPQSPVVRSDLGKARPGGRVLVTEHSIIRYAQNLSGGYGLGVNAFEIVRLSETEYEEKPASEAAVVEGSGSGWNGVGMHQVDAHEVTPGNWLALVDGRGRERLYGPAGNPWHRTDVVRTR